MAAPVGPGVTGSTAASGPPAARPTAGPGRRARRSRSRRASPRARPTTTASCSSQSATRTGTGWSAEVSASTWAVSCACTACRSSRSAARAIVCQRSSRGSARIRATSVGQPEPLAEREVHPGHLERVEVVARAVSTMFEHGVRRRQRPRPGRRAPRARPRRPAPSRRRCERLGLPAGRAARAARRRPAGRPRRRSRRCPRCPSAGAGC